MIKFLFLFFISIPLISLADDCINTDDPKARIIYLHGMNLKNHTVNEKKRRILLKKISKEKNIEIFLPRASMVCPKNKNMLCWMWGSDTIESLKAKWGEIRHRSNKCFNSRAKLIFLGFSNGGNFLNQVFQACTGGNFITVGASGGSLANPIANLSKCGKYYSAIGKNDKRVYENGKKFINNLKKLKAKVNFIHFDGGHELPEPVFLSLLKQYGI